MIHWKRCSSLSIRSTLLAAAAVFSLGSQAQALSIVIDGVAVGGYPGNGPNIGQNNVFNAPNSGLLDGANGGNFLGKGGLTSGTISVVGNVSTYFGVEWWFAGAESGDTIQLTAVNALGANLVNSENNQNNNCNSCGASSQIGPQLLGTTYQAGNGKIQFSLKDLTTGQSVNNAASNNNIPNQDGFSSIVFSYLTDPSSLNFPTSGTLSTTNSTVGLWFAFAFNDNGSSDDNHDDYVGFARVFEVPDQVDSPTPVPAALPLMGTVLAGGFLTARWRKRRAARKSA